MRTFLGVVIAVLVLAAAVLFSLSVLPQPAEKIPPDAVRVSSNGTVTVIFPWAISLATKWWAGPVDGLHISEDASSASIWPAYPLPVGIRIFTVTAEQPGTYLFPAWWIMTGEENTVRWRVPEFSQALVFSDAAENSAAVVAYRGGEIYTLETDMDVPRVFLPLKTNGTAQIVFPWYSSLGMEWSMEVTDGLNITETRHINPLPPYGKHQGKYVYTITANAPGIYLFHARYIRYGKDAPFAEFSVILLVSDTSGVSEITVEYVNDGEYRLTPELLDITFREMLVNSSAPSTSFFRTAPPTPVPRA
ncbi:MAG: hypothetical protein LBL85_03960 [Methanocalculaceae archaeon]|jgi:predicted secreted protein|nr:hypothetical protein [Methanocalculaceae archaeon]